MSSRSPRLCVVLVVFNQAWEQTLAGNSLNSLSGDFGLLVCDNSPYPQSDFIPNLEQFKYVHQSDNPGVSKSYNLGAVFAKDWGCTHILLLDQDTKLPQNWFEVIMDAIVKFPNEAVFAPVVQVGNEIISPAKNRFGRTWVHIDPLDDVILFQNYTPINSGLCIKLDVFNLAGGYNELARLDFSDFIFIEHLKNAGINMFRLLSLNFFHSLSGMEYQTKASALNRFKYFCEGAKIHAITSGSFFSRIFWTFVRANLLMFRYKELRFLKVFYQNFLVFNPKASTFTK